MKHFLTLNLMAIALAFGVACGVTAKQKAQRASGAAPKLVIEETDFNFGTVKEGVKVAHTFTVRNEGQANLEIIKVAPS